MTIRPLRLRDVPALSRMYVSLSEEDRRFFHPFPFQLWLLVPVLTLIRTSSLLCPLVRRVFPRLAFLSLVAYDPARRSLAGSGYLRLSRPPGDSKLLAGLGIVVAEPYRGKGLGPDLMDSLVRLASRHNVGRIFLVVLAENERAMALYRKCGFNTVAGMTERWQGRDYPGYRMELALDGPPLPAAETEVTGTDAG